MPNVIAIPGGLPIRLGDDVIVGAAVSGSHEVDEPCVQAGLESQISSNEPIPRGGSLHRSAMP